jgi:hypothetical protein
MAGEASSMVLATPRRGTPVEAESAAARKSRRAWMVWA